MLHAVAGQGLQLPGRGLAAPPPTPQPGCRAPTSGGRRGASGGPRARPGATRRTASAGQLREPGFQKPGRHLPAPHGSAAPQPSSGTNQPRSVAQMVPRLPGRAPLCAIQTQPRAQPAGIASRGVGWGGSEGGLAGPAQRWLRPPRVSQDQREGEQDVWPSCPLVATGARGSLAMGRQVVTLQELTMDKGQRMTLS